MVETGDGPQESDLPAIEVELPEDESFVEESRPADMYDPASGVGWSRETPMMCRMIATLFRRRCLVRLSVPCRVSLMS